MDDQSQEQQPQPKPKRGSARERQRRRKERRQVTLRSSSRRKQLAQLAPSGGFKLSTINTKHARSLAISVPPGRAQNPGRDNLRIPFW